MMRKILRRCLRCHVEYDLDCSTATTMYWWCSIECEREAQAVAKKEGRRVMERIYIAGPMHGKDGHNFKAFDNAADLGRARGYDMVSPADIDRQMGFDGKGVPSTLLKRQMIQSDIQALFTCDTLALLPDWETSLGANVEVALARFLNMPIVDAITLKPLEINYAVHNTGTQKGTTGKGRVPEVTGGTELPAHDDSSRVLAKSRRKGKLRESERSGGSVGEREVGVLPANGGGVRDD